MRKRIISMMLVICMVLMYVPTTAFAASSGETNDGLKYTISDDNKVTITGYNTNKIAAEIDIPNSIDGKTVTAIGENAFYGCIKLVSVTIPNSVTSIGKNAFAYFYGLQSVTIPESVKSIGEEAFIGCNNLTSVTVPEGVTSIGGSAFKGCTRLESVTIPNSVTSIGGGAFENTPWLSNTQSPNKLVVVNRIIIYGKTAEGEVIIPEGVITIADEAFSGCTGLTSVTIQGSVTSIGNKAFSGCTGLTSVTIPGSVTSIGNYAFSGCKGLSSVEIPTSVTSIGERAFENCEKLASVTIPNSVTSIGDFAFCNCSNLISITIPDSVTSIGEGAFCGCTGLTSVNIPERVTSIEMSTFFNCPSLKSINIPDSVKTIGNQAFEGCTSFKSVTIPSKVTSIGAYAFKNCTGLKSINIPDGVTSIETETFRDCKGLTSVTIPSSVTSIGSYAFDNCTGLTSVDINGGVTSIGQDAFYNCTSLGSITIPASVETIENQAFCNCKSLTSITIPTSVTSIGNSVFRGCTGLTSLTIPSKVTTIGSSVFEGCTSLTSLTIPSEVTIIGGSSFKDCTGLTSVEIPASVTYIGSYVFQNCSGLTTIYLPDKENLTIGDDTIPATASQVSYSLDTANNKVTITKIPGESKVDIPATICGYPVVAVANENLLNKISSHIHLGVNCTDKVKCTICGKEYIHNLVNIPAKAATYITAGNKEYWQCKVCDKYFSDEKGTNEINQQDTVIPKLIYYKPTEDVSIPVENGSSVDIKAEIKDGTANVSEITSETIDKIVDNVGNKEENKEDNNGENKDENKDENKENNNEDNKDENKEENKEDIKEEPKVDTIKIDLSGAKQEVTAVTLSKTTVETLATTTAKEDNGIDTVTIELSKASVVLDSKTLETVAKEAEGNDIKLVINDKEQSKLNTSQQNAIKDYHVATSFEAYFESNGKEIHDFNGGTATVTINFEPEEGKNMDYYHMVHISDDGVMTRYKTRYTKGKLIFTTPHFSDYAVIYDESEKNQTAIERPVPVTGLDAKADKTTLTKKGAIATIKATVKPADATNKNVTYTSSNTKVATVDKTGKVKAVANGKTTITIKTVDGSFTKKIVITVKIPDPMPTKAQIAANSVVLNSNATAKWTKENYLKLTWGKVTGAAGYEIYVRKCDGKSLWTKPAYTAKSGKTTSVTLKKLSGKKFSTTANYKYGVRAYKYVNGKKVYFGTTLTYHFVGSKNKKETNAKSVTAGKKSITLKTKKTTKLTSMVSKVNKKCKLVKHDTLVRYISSNPSVAKVDLRTGKVTGVKAGKCKIYCIALNGVKATVSVTVK